jgi:hypothetical protein
MTHPAKAVTGGGWGVVLCVGIGLATPRAAWADQPMPFATAEVPGVPPAANPPERPFLFNVDPSLPAPGDVLVTAGMGNVTRTGEERPIGAGQLIPTLGAEVGLLSRLSVYADGGVAFAAPGASLPSPVTLEAGAHVLLTDPASRNLRFAIQASYGFDFTGASSLKFNATLAWNYRILRVIASVTGSHTFQPDADPIDLAASLGASVQLPAGFRAGAEFVATDMEEIADPGAEGGPAAFAGPTAGWEWKDRLQLVAGPAIGVGPGTRNAALFGRAAATVRF